MSNQNKENKGHAYAVMPATDPNEVRLTPAAYQHVIACLTKRGKGIGMRLAIKKSGCAGFKYVVDYVDTANADDHIFAIDDTYAIYIDPISFKAVKGTTIDFVKEGLNEILKYYNPNETSACGCGESFSVKS